MLRRLWTKANRTAIWEGAPATLSAADMNASLARQDTSQTRQTLAVLSALHYEVHCVAGDRCGRGGVTTRAGFHSIIVRVLDDAALPRSP